MKSISLTLQGSDCFVLPLAYNHILQGILYSIWKASNPGLHDSGLPACSRSYKPFVFSQLEGRYTVSGKQIQFSDAVSFEVRSPEDALIDDLASAIYADPHLSFSSFCAEVVNLSVASRFLFPDQCRIRFKSPVTVHRTDPDRKTVYFDPFQEEFYRAVETNFQTKQNALGCPCPGKFDLRPVEKTIHRQTTLFKGTYITSYTGTFDLSGDPQTIAVLYYCGLGARNSQGFGMFDIL